MQRYLSHTKYISVNVFGMATNKPSEYLEAKRERQNLVVYYAMRRG